MFDVNDNPDAPYPENRACRLCGDPVIEPPRAEQRDYRNWNQRERGHADKQSGCNDQSDYADFA